MMINDLENARIKLALIAMLSDPKVKIEQLSMTPQLLDISTCEGSKYYPTGKVHYSIDIYKKPKNGRRKKSKK